jgi:hypothetical protein
MNHISANYLPLVVRKQLGLYCFIEPDAADAARRSDAPAAGHL